MRKSIAKIIVIFLIIGLNWAGISAIGKTLAYFNDTEQSQNNSFQAGSLDFSLSSDNLGQINLGSKEYFDIQKDGTLDFRYNITTLIIGGSDINFCNDLEIGIYEDGVLNSATTTLSNLDITNSVTGSSDNWSFIINDTGNNSSGKVCSFNFTVKAWQNDLDYTQGFTDIESTQGVIYSDGKIGRAHV